MLFEMKFSLVQLNSVFVECCRNEYVEVNSIRNQWGKNPNQNRYTHTKYRELIETTPIHNCDSFGEKCLLNIFRYFFPIFFSILCFQVEFRNIKWFICNRTRKIEWFGCVREWNLTWRQKFCFWYCELSPIRKRKNTKKNKKTKKIKNTHKIIMIMITTIMIITNNHNYINNE